MCSADEASARQETLDIFNSTTLTYVNDSDGADYQHRDNF